MKASNRKPLEIGYEIETIPYRCVGASDGVARGGTGSVVVSRCVCSCVGRVAKCSECREKRGSGGFRESGEDGMGT